MVVISKGPLNGFSAKHPNAEAALIKWYYETKAANWRNFSDVKKTFNTVDYVGNDRYVFDIKGNQYRLVALIIFKTRTLFVLFIGSHKEYDNIDASKITFKSNFL
jgi:mRNA interferase HigB